MKKLLFLIPTLAGGGAERVLANLVNNLSREKYDITVQTLFLKKFCGFGIVDPTWIWQGLWAWIMTIRGIYLENRCRKRKVLTRLHCCVYLGWVIRSTLCATTFGEA